ncbi:hypothetical protein [Acinetobacter thermotolerans]|uniref:hypothetical protein n=1 Tax=Acinetobacter thermotolerans TaxID=3151487 RepID=UPI00325B89DC
MPENNLYYIYIDSKIEGTIDQLMGYFQANIFHPEDCICIYFKFYKDIEKYIKNKFKSTSIRIKFIRKNSDLHFIPNKVVFYLFNAQSNCRIVAHRELTHIFVTHGESHKLASIKPIIRIYDFVISSGQVGIDRFLKAGIFNLYNIQEEQRIILMGNTFIGQHHYQYDVNSDSLLYAPTWEGGISSENYSSIGKRTQEILAQLIHKNGIKTLYIQMHPNLGHRDKKYIQYLKKMITHLSKLNIKIELIKSTLKFKDHLTFIGYQLSLSSKMRHLKIKAAVTDISAMEMQLISENIPTVVLYYSDRLNNLIIPNRIKYLYSIEKSIDFNNFNNLDLSLRAAEVEQHKSYLISYQKSELLEMTFRKRISWLCHYAHQKKVQVQQHYLDAF